LHLGYAVGNPSLVSRLRDALPTGNVTGLALALIEELPGARQGYEDGRRRAVQDRVYLEQELRKIPGLGVFPSRANFVYARLPEGFDGVRLRNHLLGEHGCLLRACGDKEGSDSRSLRVAARPAGEVDFLVERWLQSASELGQLPGHPTSRGQGGLAARLQAGRSVPPTPTPPSPPVSSSMSSFTLADLSSLAAQSREAAALAAWDLTPIPEPTPTPTIATSEPFMALVEAGIISVEVTEEGIESSTPTPVPEPAPIATITPAHPRSPAWAHARSATATGPGQDGMAGFGSFASFASFVPPPSPAFDGAPLPATVTMTVTPTGVRRRQTTLLGALALFGAVAVGWFALHDRNRDAGLGTLEIRRPLPEATLPITSPLPGSPGSPTGPNAPNAPTDPPDLANLPELPPLGGALAGTGDTGLAGAGEDGGTSARTGETAAARRKSRHKGKRRLARQRHRGTHGDDDLDDGRAE
jgi:hypothetical protein